MQKQYFLRLYFIALTKSGISEHPKLEIDTGSLIQSRPIAHEMNKKINSHELSSLLTIKAV